MTAEEYYVKCEDCKQRIATGSNVQKLFERFLQLTARHNTEGMEHKLCEDAKETLSFDDLRGAFANGEYRVYEATEYEKMAIEWEPQKCSTEAMSE